MPRPARPAVALLALALAALPASAQQADPDPERFAEEITAFERWDAKNSAPRDATVFVGSSSIRFWDTADRFPGTPLINRGFGGSHISDVTHWVEQTVLRYEPSTIVFYAGDNDVGAGKKAEQVLEDYTEFVHAVLSADTQTDVVFLAIKPSLARWTLWPEMQRANAMIRTFSEEHDQLHYVDVANPMLGSDGEPMPELFVSDGLHMTPAGYDIWDGVVRRALAGVH